MYRFLGLISKATIYPDLDPIQLISANLYIQDTCFSPLINLIHKLAIPVNINDIIIFSNYNIVMLKVKAKVNILIGNLVRSVDYQTTMEVDFINFQKWLFINCLNLIN